ncbi:MAG: ABC transporter permease [Oscillospiraceae bacterium]|nr:ABC transporter permease [Oscillospiraceae bacterium]
MMLAILLLTIVPLDILNHDLGSLLSNEESLLTLTSSQAVELYGGDLSDEIKSLLPRILVQDTYGLLGDNIYMLRELNFNFIIDSEMPIEDIRTDVYWGTLYSAVIIIPNEEGQITFEYIAFDDPQFNRIDAALIASFLHEIKTTAILDNLDIPEYYTNLLTAPILYAIYELETDSFFDIAMIAPISLAILLYQVILFFCYNVASSITNEKTSRVIETLIVSTKPSTIVVGKTIGMGIVGILQLLFLGIVLAFSFQAFVSVELHFLNDFIASLELSPFTVTIFFAYFLLGYLFFSFFSAIAGSAAGRPEDIQLTILPISLSLIIALVVSIATLIFPDERISHLVAMLPFTSPFAMPGRLISGYASNVEVFVSLGFLVVAIFFIAFIAIRIYAVAILHYGNRLRLKDLFNIALKIK